jgi:hypothetical protein
MQSNIWKKIALMLAFCNYASAAEPLPIRTDIGENFSTVLCPTDAAAKRMLQEFYVPGESWFDSQTFFEGLAATSCEQKGGPIRIVQAMERKTLRAGEPASVYLRYRGVSDGNAPNKVFFGIVHEDGNNRHPRTALQQWLQTYSLDGVIDVDAAGKGNAGKLIYRCASLAVAQKVIQAIPKAQKGAISSAQSKAKDAALKANQCVLARGKFAVVSLHEVAQILLGDEWAESWHAIHALDESGRFVGLLHDDDLM